LAALPVVQACYDLLYRKVREELQLSTCIIVVENVKSPVPRIYSDAKMQVLKQEHGVIGYLDEVFMAPDVVVQALQMAVSIEKVLVETDQTRKSITSHKLLEYLTKSEDEDGRLKSCCIFVSEGDRSYRYASTISKFSEKSCSWRVNDVRPAMWLTKGVSDQDKQVVQREQYHFNEPPVDSTEDAEEYLAENEILLTSGVSEVKLFNRDVLFAPCFFTAFAWLSLRSFARAGR
jgi:hypothetical protein